MGHFKQKNPKQNIFTTTVHFKVATYFFRLKSECFFSAAKHWETVYDPKEERRCHTAGSHYALWTSHPGGQNRTHASKTLQISFASAKFRVHDSTKTKKISVSRWKRLVTKRDIKSCLTCRKCIEKSTNKPLSLPKRVIKYVRSVLISIKDVRFPCNYSRDIQVNRYGCTYLWDLFVPESMRKTAKKKNHKIFMWLFHIPKVEIAMSSFFILAAEKTRVGKIKTKPNFKNANLFCNVWSLG